GGAVSFASGFAEVGEEGAELERQLVEAAGDMPIAGPNCYGTLNYLDGVTLWPDQHGGKPVDEGVAILSQSGNIAINMTMQQRDVPIAYMASLGNQAVMGVTEFIEAMLDDPRIKAIGILIEGVKDVPAFARAATRALEKGVPIVAIKSGRSEAGAAITVSHTSTLSGADNMYAALFDRLGIYRCYSIPAFMEALKFLGYAGTLGGNRIASLSCSGGEAAMVADCSNDLDLDFDDFTDDQRSDIRSTLNDLVSISNPFDYHTFIWGDEEKLEATYTAVLRCGYDVTQIMMDYPKPGLCDVSEWDKAARAFASGVKSTGSLGVMISSLQEAMPEETRQWLLERGIIPMQGLDDALHAYEAAAWIGKHHADARAGNLPSPMKAVMAIDDSDTHTLDEWESKQTLAGAGLSIPDAQMVSAADAPTAATELGYPVVVKAVSADLTHKTDAGGVALHLNDEQAVVDAVQGMKHLSDQFLVERMMGGAIAELIVGVERDPQFGPVLVIGAGGVLVELLQDAKTLLLPTSRDDVKDAVESLKIAVLLGGYRGGPAADMDAIVDNIMAVATYAQDNWNDLRELDVNPLLALENGAVAVDALIRKR
ncbi:MAG: acetate--CoA ligase family protein, partial [Rhodospirillales bacterium]|nr:acetate--CoA ligase family protein [Rhodospirillales bacterium]